MDRQFFGVFSSGPLYVLPIDVDLYGLDANNKTASFNGTFGREHRHTPGGRGWGKIGATGRSTRASTSQGAVSRIGRG